MARTYESNGPDVKIRGTALHVAEKYLQLARDAQASGDRVGGENYFQHAEHYFRIVAAAQAQMPQSQPTVRNENDDNDEDERNISDADRAAGPQPFVPQPTFGLTDPQPYVNGNGQDRAEGEDGPNGSYDNRQDARENRNPGGNRGRRRRPYRDRTGEQPEAGESDGQSEAATSPATDD